MPIPFEHYSYDGRITVCEMPVIPPPHMPLPKLATRKERTTCPACKHTMDGKRVQRAIRTRHAPVNVLAYGRRNVQRPQR